MPFFVLLFPFLQVVSCLSIPDAISSGQHVSAKCCLCRLKPQVRETASGRCVAVAAGQEASWEESRRSSGRPSANMLVGVNAYAADVLGTI